MKRRTQARSVSGAVRLMIGLLISVGVTVAAILLFALAIQLFELDENWITPINQLIKVFSILSGTVYVCRGGLRGYRCGPLLGLLYMGLGIALYCASDGKLLPMTVMLGDFALGAAAGFLSGLLASSLKREK